MMQKWLEEWHDTLLYLGAIVGLLGFFLNYWNGEYQTRYAELVLRDFLSEVTVTGSITQDRYERLIKSLDKISASYDVEVNCIEYIRKPVYALIPEEELSRYYMGRNVKKDMFFSEYEPFIEEVSADSLRLQKESNASILGEEHNKLPLPGVGGDLTIEALRPVQQVYEGENLLTVCRISSAEGEYYAEAENVTATASGIVFLHFFLENVVYQIPVQVYCYPRTVFCENGHEVVNSEAIFTENKIISKTDCPYCEILPEYIVCSTEMIHKETGTELTKKDIEIAVVYMNGDTELVTPESMEWQDSYDKNYCGIQRVKVQYRGKEEAFLVVSENGVCRQCNGECNERCYEDYVIFPYCIECMSEVPLFAGKVYQEEYGTSYRELMLYLDNNKEKNLKTGDVVYVYLSKQGKYITFLQGVVMQDGKVR